MSYIVENVNGCTKKLAFNFEELDLTSEIKSALVKKQKEVSLKGFRKGKAPLSMVEQIYRSEVENDALNSFIHGQLMTAIQKEDLKVVGYPNFENMKYEAGKSVQFDAIVETYPDFELKDMSSLSFKKTKTRVLKKEIEDVRKNYLASKAEMVEVKDEKIELAEGQFAIMNFQGVTESGERPESMKGDEFVLEIGSGQFIPGFEEKMIGMKKAEKKNIELTFPSDYHAQELKDAKVTFEVELLEIKEKVYPEVSEEIAKELGFESEKDFDAKIKENIKTQKDNENNQKLQNDILEKLISENKFDVPNSILEQQKGFLRNDISKNLQNQGFNEEMIAEYFEKWAGDLTAKADFQVRSGLILDKIAKENEIKATEEDFENKLEETAKSSKIDVEEVKKYYSSNDEMKKNILYAIREEKVFNKIQEIVEVK